jgi:heme oxygenase
LNLERLRRETSDAHAAIEGSMPLMESSLTREEYVQCLQRLYGVVAAWEEGARAQAPAWLQGMLAARQRRYLLEEDLAWFGVETPGTELAALPVLRDEANLLGAMYVMEGSTLGGQLISRQVAKVLGLEDGRGHAFFQGHGSETGVLWKEFCDVLRNRVVEEDAPVLIGSARSMFETFGSWMQIDAVIEKERADEGNRTESSLRLL